jgi:KDO2-lipid IV(A) lauroyltransferase
VPTSPRRRDGPGARRLRDALALLVPGAGPAELDALVHAGLRSYARYWCEVFRLPAMDPRRVHAAMDPHVRGAEPIFEALGQGRGVVVALTHSGNWDVAGVWLVEALRAAGHDPSFTTVAARLRPRASTGGSSPTGRGWGSRWCPPEDGARAYRALHGRLRRGGVVCLVSDVDLSASGVDVTFLGAAARLPGGAARLAAATGAVLLPVVPSFTPDAWAVDIAPPVPVPDRAGVPKAVQGLADAFGPLLARAAAGLAHAPAPVTPCGSAAAGTGAVRVGIVCPVLARRAGRGAGARPRPGPRAAPPRARRRRPGPRHR